MNLTQLIKAFTAKSGELEARMKEILKSAAEDDDGPRTLTDAEQNEYDSIEKELASVKAHVKRLEKQRDEDAATATAPNTDPDRKAPTVVVKSGNVGPDEDFKGQRYIQLVKARAVAHLDGSSVAEVTKHMYGDTLAPFIMKAADPVVSGDVPKMPGVQDFVEILREDSAYDKLNFRRVAPHVPIATQTVQASANFIGEGATATASKWAATTTTLAPHKVVSLVPQTIEAVRDNSIGSDRLVMMDMAGAIRNKVDSVMFSNAAASGTAIPAGLLNGAPSLVTSGVDPEDLTADIKGVLNFIPRLVSMPTLLMSPRLAFAIATVRTDLGVSVFPSMSINGGTLEGLTVKVSNAIPDDQIIALVESEIYSILDQGVQIAVSTEASVGGDSAFENGLVIFRAIRPVSWSKRRSDVVVLLDNVHYGATPSTTAT